MTNPTPPIDVTTMDPKVLNTYSHRWTELPYHNLSTSDQEFVVQHIADYLERKRVENPFLQAKDITLEMLNGGPVPTTTIDTSTVQAFVNSAGLQDRVDTETVDKVARFHHDLPFDRLHDTPRSHVVDLIKQRLIERPLAPGQKATAHTFLG